jgi:hypothetical protein
MSTAPVEVAEFHVGDSVKAAAACDRMPPGTIVGYAHPIYQGAISAVRVENAVGDRWWAEAGNDRQWSAEEIKRRTGWAPFVVLYLPDVSPPLNTEVRTGYRTYGEKKD